MEPILKEEYILTKETYFAFTRDKNKSALDKNKSGIKVTSYIQVIVGIVFILSTVISGQKVGILFILLAAALVVVGLSGKIRLSGYEKKVAQSLEKSYEERGYGENLFEVKFYEDKLDYSVGGQCGELKYSEFAAFYEGIKYFAIHFTSGEVIIFNKSCEVGKIKELLTDYKEKHQADEPEKELEPQELIEEKAEPLADDWYMQENTTAELEESKKA